MKTPYTITSGGAVSIKAIDALRHPDVQAELAKVRRFRESHFIGLSAHEKEQQKFAEARVRMFANSKHDVMRMWRAQPRAHDCTLGWPVVKAGARRCDDPLMCGCRYCSAARGEQS